MSEAEIIPIRRNHSTATAGRARDATVREFDITGKAMRGWLVVEPAGVATDEELRDWVSRCVAFVRTLPAKK